MTKTVAIDDDVHMLVYEKQLDIKKRYGINLKISFIINSILRNYIDKLEEILKDELCNTSPNIKNVGIIQQKEAAETEIL